MKKVTEVLICGTVITVAGIAAAFVAKGMSNVQQIKRRKVVL